MNIDSNPLYMDIIDDNNIVLSDILDVQEIQRIQNLFSDATGVASLVTTPDGTPITNPSNFCSLCNLVRSTEKGLANCLKSDELIGSKSEISRSLLLKPCLSAGLWDAGCEISVGGKHIANWLIGQIRDKELSEDGILDYADEIGVDKVEFIKAFREVPIMSASQFRKVSEMLIMFANQLSEKAYSNYKLRPQISESEKINNLLHKSEEELSITLQSIGDGVISTDKNGLIVNMNHVAEKLCGQELSSAKGKPLDDVFRVINSETRIPIKNPVGKVLQTGKIIGLANHTLLLSNDGSEYHIADSAAPITNNNGIIQGVVLVFSDITEAFLAGEKVRKSELRYRGLLNTLDAGVVVHAPDASIIMCNPKSCQLLGLTEEQLKGKSSFDKDWNFLTEQALPMSVDDYPVMQIIREKKPLINFIVGVKSPSKNDIIWIALNGYPVIDSDDEISEIVISFIDITNRKKAEKALLERDRYLIETQAIAQLGTYNLDIRTNQWTSSALMDRIFGIDLDYNRTTKNWISIVHPDWQQIMGDYFKNNILKRKAKFDKVYQIIRPNDHQVRWVHGRGELVLDENSEPIKLIGTIQDITDSKQTELALVKSEKKYRSIFENVQDVFFQVDMDGIITEISPSINFYHGFKRANIIGKSIFNFYVSLSDREILISEIKKNIEIRDYELDLKSMDGTVVKHTSINARLVIDNKGNPIYVEGAIRDITKRKNAEKALKQNETFLRETQFLAKLGTFNFNLNEDKWESSDILDVILGIDAKDNRTFKGWKSLIHPDWVTEVSDYFSWKVKQTKGLYDIKYKIIRKNDGQERWVHTIGRLFYNDKNRLVRVIGTLQDITERKNAKEALRDSQEQLKKFATHLQDVREEERLMLAREIHDELGQILIAIKIDLGMMKQKVLKLIPESDLSIVQYDFEGLFTLVNTTLNTARKIMTDLRPEVLYLVGFVEAVKLYATNFQERYKISCHFQNEIPDLVLNSQQSVPLYRILQESLANVSRHSMATSVQIAIREERRKLFLEISDNGIGFDTSLVKKHDSFGLIGIKERIFLLDGEFRITSNPGKGTIINIEIPYNKSIEALN